MIDRNPEWNKVGLCGIVFVRPVCIRVVYGQRWSYGLDSSSEGLLLHFLALGALFSGVNGRTLGRLFDLHVLLCPYENVPHLGDIVLHQMLVE